MNILAMDTTSLASSVSIKKENKISTIVDSNKITHSEKLLKLIDSALIQNNLSIGNINLLMTTNGPGSFTGSRIGIVTVKALSAPKNLPIIAVSSIEAIAFNTYLKLNTKEERNVCVLIDAKNERAYYGMYNFKYENDKIVSNCKIEISNEPLQDIFSKLNSNIPIILCGNIEKNILDNYMISSNCNILQEICECSSEFLIDFYNKANEVTIHKHIYNTFDLDVIYARMSQAERIKNGEV